MQHETIRTEQNRLRGSYCIISVCGEASGSQTYHWYMFSFNAVFVRTGHNSGQAEILGIFLCTSINKLSIS